jgi:Ca-activated chloride channel family protein
MNGRQTRPYSRNICPDPPFSPKPGNFLDFPPNKTMLNPNLYANSLPAGIAALQVMPSSTGRGTATGESSWFIPLRTTEISGALAGPLAELAITHRFLFARTQFDRPVEAIYRFPLPGDAAVRRVTVHFGDTQLESVLQPREEATAQYEKARSQGEQAALTTRESPDVFTVRLAGLRPDEPIEIVTRLVVLARAQGSGFSLRFPLTTAPRFVGRNERDSAWAQGQPLALLRDPGYRVSCNLLLHGESAVTSPTHTLALQRSEDKTAPSTRISFAEGEILPDRDLVLIWQPSGDAERPAFQLFTHRETGEPWLYFAALLTAPARTVTELPAVPREVTLVVDHSGSMTGPKWQAADWTVESFLRRLGPADRFALAVFHDHSYWFAHELVAATPDAVERATAWLQRQQSSGGTVLATPLAEAMQLPRTEAGSRHTVILTDAQVSDGARLLDMVQQEAARPDARRLSILCIDTAPNAHLVHTLVEAGGGLAAFLTSAPEAGDVTTALETVLDSFAAPLFTDLQLVVNTPGLEIAGGRMGPAVAGQSSADLGELPAGGSRWLVGRAPVTGNDPVQFNLVAGEQPLHAGITVPVTAEAAELPALRALFGAQRVGALEFLSNSRYFSPAVLADRLSALGYNTAALRERPEPSFAADFLSGLIRQEALHFGVISSETAMVVVHPGNRQPVAGTAIIPNTLPGGWSDPFLSAPTAASPQAMRSFAPPAQAGVGFDMLRNLVRNSLPGAKSPPPAKQVNRLSEPDMPLPAGQALALPVSAGAKQELVIFQGSLAGAGEPQTLFDSRHPAMTAKPWPESGLLLALAATVHGQASPTAWANAMLELFVGDLLEPRATIRLDDLVRAGKRPLNVRFQPGEVVLLRLAPHSVALPAAQLELHIELEKRRS